MAKLILSMDGLVLKEIPLTKDRTTIGRKPHNDIQIDNLAISGEHAAIVTILNDSFLEDLNSTNGTYVNGQPIKKHVLQPNDVIELGKYRLKYLAERVSPSAQGDYDKTIILRPEGRAAPPEPPCSTATTTADAAAPAGTIPASDSSAPTLDSAAAAQVKPIPAGVIQVLNGVHAGRELELNKTLTTLGKPGVQVAVITRRPQGYFITHVEGASRPLLNGRELDAQAQPLHDQDVVELAGVKMGFFLKK